MSNAWETFWVRTERTTTIRGSICRDIPIRNREDWVKFLSDHPGIKIESLETFMTNSPEPIFKAKGYKPISLESWATKNGMDLSR